ncbi:MAG: VWA domain-containing protein [Bryobacterales bacterium]|nr:VWA domain-containing protein [Bryobacterales bacterium]
MTAVRSILLLGVAIGALAQPVEIVNTHGGVSVGVADENRLRIWWTGTEPHTNEGIVVSRSPVRLLVEAQTPVGRSADVEVRLPLGLPFAVKTDHGDIDVTGMVRRASLQSARGSLSVEVPLEITVIGVESTKQPSVVDTPRGRSMPLRAQQIGPRMRVWKLMNSVASRDLVYGHLTAQLHSPSELRVRDWEIPRDWPLKPHTGAERIADALMLRGSRRGRSSSPPPQTRRAPRPSASESTPTGTVVFSSEVRMVSMTVAVSDAGGRPMIGLSHGDFVVEEDGERQDVQVVDPEDSPFNLAILLDLSGSTSVDLEHMRGATRRLVELAGANDRVALYAMAGSMFHRLVPLTSDRDLLVRRLMRLPQPIGGSPIWDVVMIAYEDQLAERAGERNALVVISDGIDNRISGQSVPSRLSAAKLIRAAGEMDTRIYPVFLLSGERFGRNWSSTARKRLEALTKATGGRLFTARSVADVEPVLPELAKELRSVYEIAYYPANQQFDGSWRRVSIKVGSRGARVRARPGYFAD